LTIQSLTKYYDGLNIGVGGALVNFTKELYERTKLIQNMHGNIMAPMTTRRKITFVRVLTRASTEEEKEQLSLSRARLATLNIMTAMASSSSLGSSSSRISSSSSSSAIPQSTAATTITTTDGPSPSTFVPRKRLIWAPFCTSSSSTTTTTLWWPALLYQKVCPEIPKEGLRRDFLLDLFVVVEILAVARNAWATLSIPNPTCRR
jgi:hypothetical protein